MYQIPMHRSGNDFTYIHNVKRGRHAYKFVVDDEWRFAPDQVINFYFCIVWLSFLDYYIPW